jgi:hypothetical protein
MHECPHCYHTWDDYAFFGVGEPDQGICPNCGRSLRDRPTRREPDGQVGPIKWWGGGWIILALWAAAIFYIFFT